MNEKNFSLDKYQNEVINCDTNALIIAAAGSGKTFTLIKKVQYLIENKNVNPTDIAMISFTNASVNDIKSRLDYDIDVFTFHKLSINILEKAKVNYQLLNNNLLYYIIRETILTCPPQQQKQILNFLKIKTTFNNFCYSQEFNSFIKFIETFINLWKTNSLNFNDISLKRLSKKEKEILTFIFNIYKKYLEEKASTNSFDFDDLIIIAKNYVKDAQLSYKYLIIDEFQDTSTIRYNLIQEIQKYTNAKIIVVGDDYQSIYRFSGCNLNIFLTFTEKIENVKTIKLKNVYRNSQELIDIANKFITKNPLQIKKELISNKSNSNPIIFSPYHNPQIMFKKLLDYLLNFSSNIMILTRNHKDIFSYIDEEFLLNDTSLIYKNTILPFYTVHKSKGLESDYVIILNCNNTLLGFPNQIENNFLINKIIPHNEIKFAEERRLFYVGLTRCRLKTFLLYDKHNPSSFIKELKKIVKSRLKKIAYFH